MGSSLRFLLAAVAVGSSAACVSAPSSAWSVDDLWGNPAEAGQYASFLAARYAGMSADPVSAARYYRDAFAVTPLDSSVLERAVFATLIEGDVPVAITTARAATPAVAKGAAFGSLALVVDDIARGKAKPALARLKTSDLGPINTDVARALNAWLVMNDDVEAAVKMVAPLDGRRRLVGELSYLQGFLYAAKGKDKEALDKFNHGWHMRARQPVLTAANIRMRAALGDVDGAKRLVDEYRLEAGRQPEVEAVAAMLAAGMPLKPVRLSAKEGAALSLFVLTAGPMAQSNAELGTVYFSMALHLDPTFDLVRINLADTLSQQSRRRAAIDVLRGVKPPSPYYATARVETAWLEQGDGGKDAALAAVKTALAASRDRDVVLEAGAVMRALGRHADAEALFDEAVKADVAAGRADWRPLFARAGQRSELGRWPDAEDDLLRAMEIAPDEADVLNFLGFAWVDRGEKVKEGLTLIERAVQSEPDRGYIVDSLGWANYRLGRYEEAVTQLERAVELSPTDAEITDHLGDAYWSSGRRLDASYEWRRALQLSPEPDLAIRLQDKLATGLVAPTQRAAAGASHPQP